MTSRLDLGLGDGGMENRDATRGGGSAGVGSAPEQKFVVLLLCARGRAISGF